MDAVSEPRDTEAGAFARAVDRLAAQFGQLPRDAVVSILADSYRVVVEAAGEPLLDKAEELARIRLEVRTGRPATRVGPGT